MKKILFILMGLVTSFTIMAQNGDYMDPDTGIEYQYKTDNYGTKATLIDGKNCSKWRIVIPSTISVSGIGNVDVIAIGEGAFKENTFIKYVKIGDNVKTIGNRAFSYCSKLQLLELPSCLESIDDNAFLGCSRLVHVRCNMVTPQSFVLQSFPGTLNNNNFATLYVPSYEAKAAYSVTAWTNIFGDRIYVGDMNYFATSDGTSYVGASIDKNATLLWGSNNTETSGKITVKKEVERVLDENNKEKYNVVCIGSYAFENDNTNPFGTFSTLEIQEGVKTICNSAFYYWSNLSLLTLPTTLTTIGESAFQNCGQLELLTLPKNLRSIARNAFVGCGNLKHVWCKVDNLSKLSFPYDVAHNNYCFPLKETNKMMTLYVPNNSCATSVWTPFFGDRVLIGNMAYRDYTDDKNDTFKFVVCEDGSNNVATLLRCNASGNVTIPTKYGADYNVTGIDKEAFKNQSDIVELTIPEYVATIGPDAFSGCSGLVRVVSEPTSLPKVINASFNNARYLYVPQGYKSNYSSWTSFSLVMEGKPKLVSSDSGNRWDYIYSDISNEAVLTGGNSDIKGLDELVIPKTLGQSTYKVVAIDNYAFSGSKCSILKFEDDKSSLDAYIIIGENAFRSCTNLHTVDLPSQLKKVYNNAFAYCSNLNNIICRSTSSDVFAPNAFPEYAKATLFAKNNNSGWDFSNINVYDGNNIELFKTNENGFEGTYVGWVNSSNNANNAKLVKGSVPNSNKDIIIPPSVTSKQYDVVDIGMSAFQNCSNLEMVHLPSSLTAIGENAFNGCSKLMDIEIEKEDPFEINSNVFSNYNASIFVPEGKTSAYLGKTGWNGFKLENTYEGLRQVGTDKDELYTLVYGSKGDKAKLTKLKINKEEITVPSDVPVTIQNSTDIVNLKVRKLEFDNNGLSGKVSLKKLELAEGINYVSENSFQNCTNLKEIKLPASIKSIGDKAFDGCPLVTIVSQISKDDLTPIAPTVFSNPIPLVSIFIPENSLGTYTNNDKGGWARTDFIEKYIEGEKDNCPDENDPNMKYEYYTYNNTAELTHIIEAKETIEIPSTVRIKDKSGNVDTYTVNAVRENVVKNVTDKYGIKNLKIDGGVKSIGKSAFEGCSGLKKVWLPSTLKSIGVDAFKGCSSITHIGCEAVAPPSISESSFAQTTPPVYLLVPDEAESAYVNNTTWKQGRKVFKGIFVNEKNTDDDNRPLTFICLEHKKIEKNELNENDTITTRTAVLTKSTTSVADVEIPSKVTYNENSYNITIIDESAFSGSRNLENLTIPESIESIGNNAFAACTSLKNVVCKIENPLSIGDNVFYKSTSNKIPAALYVHKNSYGNYIGDDAWNKFSSVHNGLRITPTTATGLIYEYAAGETDATLIKAEATSSIVSIDESIDDAENGKKDVKVIAKSAFSSNKNSVIKTLTIPESVNSIGENAFTGCTGLTELTLPSSITDLGAGAFSNSSALKTIYCDIDKDKDGKLIDYNDNVFPASFNAKTEIFIPEGSISAYKEQAGWNTYSDNYIEGRRIPEAKADGDYAKMTFEFMTGDHTATLKYVTELDVTEDGLVRIPGNVIYDGKTYSVKKIGGNVFKNVDKSKIKKLEIQRPQEDLQTSIDANAFDGCSRLEKVWLPSTLTSIGAEAFKGCTAIKYIGCMAEIPADISDNSFPQTTNAVYLLVPDDSKVAYENKDYWIQGGKRIFEGKFINEKTTDDANQPLTFICLDHKNKAGEYVPGTAILTKSATSTADVMIPSTVSINNNKYNVTIIDESAFSGSSKLENLTIPESIEYIGGNAFATCTNLKNVTCKIASPLPISDNDNVFYKTNGQILAALYVPEDSYEAYNGDGAIASAAEWKRFSSVHKGFRIEKTTTIGLTYEYATGETNVTLIKAEATSDIVSIDDHIDDATYGKKNIKVIAKSAFSSTKNSIIKTLTIPEGVNTIGENAFTGCTGLTELTLPSSLTDIDAGAFKNSAALKIIYCDIDKDKDGKLIKYNENVFPTSFNTKPEIFIPIESKSVYQNQDGWKTYSAYYIEGRRILNTPADNYPTMVFEFMTGDKEATLTNVTSIDTTNDEDGLIIIPGVVNYNNDVYTVKTIGQDVFKNVDKTQIKKLEIQPGIRVISSNAFDGCRNLQKVWLPSSLNRIGDNAFRGCTSITHIGCWSDDVPTISEYTFPKYTAYLIVRNDTKEKYMNNKYWHKFEEGKNVIYEGKFIDVINYQNVDYICLENADDYYAILTSASDDVTIPSKVPFGTKEYKVTTIAQYAFGNNNNITGIEIPSTVSLIGAYAFQNCGNLNEIKLPANLKAIYDGTFSGNRKLESITLSDNLETIGDDAFKGCSSLTQLVLPQTLKSIGVRSFSGDSNLKEIVLPSKIETIKEYAFQNCTSLKQIELPASLTTIGDNIFDGCSDLTAVISKVEKENVVGNTTQSVPNAILYVPENAKDYYVNWNFLHTVKGNRELGDKNGLYYAYSSGDNQAILIGVDSEKAGENVTIPGTVTLAGKECTVLSIEKAVFFGNTVLKAVKIEKNVETIGDIAFKGCSNLRKIEFPSTLKSIGENAFDGCDNLTEVVSNSDNNDFIANNKLSLASATLYVPNGTQSWYKDAGWEFAHIYEGERVEKEWKGIRFACLRETKETGDGKDKVVTKEAILVDATSTAKEWSTGEILIPNSISIGEGESADKYEVIGIASKAFCGNTDVKMVELPATLTSIDANAFEGCTNLTEVVSKIVDPVVIKSIALSLPEAILFVSDRTLYENTDWMFAQIFVGDRAQTEENGISYICATGDKKAFLVKGIADKLGDSVNIPSSVTITVGEGESSKNIECSVISIAANAFQGCSDLKKIWLPSTIGSIGENAFDGCNDIAYICTTNATPLSVNKNVFSTYKATLYVPNGSISSYSENETWKTFPILREGYFEGVTTQSSLTFECLVSGENKVATLTKSDATETTVDIPATVKLDNTVYSVTTIYKDAFRGNNSKKLEKIVFPESLRKIEDKTFDQCTKLAVITSKVKKDNLFAFNKNVFPETIYNTAAVYVPNDADGSTEAKYKATDGWKNFKNWARGEKKTGTVGSMTYEYLKGIGTATLIGTTVDKEIVTVDGTVVLEGDSYTVTAIAESAFKNNPNKGKMTKLKIAENITTIGTNAFQGCGNLKMVWLPSSITSLGEKAFDGCNGITHVSSSIGSPVANDASYFPNNATLYVPTGGKDKYNVSGWNNVSYMAEGEFVDVCTDNGNTYDCLLKNGNKNAILRKYAASSNDVVIPSTVKLGEDSYTVSIIGKSAFANKTSITSLMIPSGIEDIDADVFSGCTKLTWIESKIENPINIAGKNVFANSSATLFIPSAKVDEYRAKGWNFLNIFVGDRKETTIDGWTYVYSTGDKKAILTKVNNVGKDVTINGTFKIGKDEYTVTAIAESVFKGKTNIEGLIISENIENIGASAFLSCEKIERIDLPSTLKVIGDNAFDGCSSLVSVTCKGSTPATVGGSAFPSYSITLNVPNDAVATYKENASWGQFTTILGIVTTISDETDENTADYVDTTTDEDGAAPTVALVDGTDVEGDYVIPQTVVMNGVAHAVTAIGTNAFKNNTSLTDITISSNITAIGESAFAGCENLASITVEIAVPLDLSAPAATRGLMTRSGGSSIFEGVNKSTCILYVPSGSVDAYKAAPVWGDFENILPIGTTVINGVIISDDGKPFDVYNIQGRKVKANTTTLKGLPSGIYIVNGKKLMVK